MLKSSFEFPHIFFKYFFIVGLVMPKVMLQVVEEKGFQPLEFE